jgi:hypothetical protein
VSSLLRLLGVTLGSVMAQRPGIQPKVQSRQNRPRGLPTRMSAPRYRGPLWAVPLGLMSIVVHLTPPKQSTGVNGHASPSPQVRRT